MGLGRFEQRQMASSDWDKLGKVFVGLDRFDQILTGLDRFGGILEGLDSLGRVVQV